MKPYRQPRWDECRRCHSRKSARLFRVGWGGSVYVCTKCGCDWIRLSLERSDSVARAAEFDDLALNPYARGLVRRARKDYICRSSDPGTDDRSLARACHVVINGGDRYLSAAVGFTYALCLHCGAARYPHLFVTPQEAERLHTEYIYGR